jgi:hypothetical protein
MRDPKTADQLQREIAYFAGLIRRTTSRDRQRRAHRALALRQRLLAGVPDASRRRTRPPRHRGRDPMAVSRADVQVLADQILERLGTRIRSGQMIVHYHDGLVQRLEVNTVHRPAPRRTDGLQHRAPVVAQESTRTGSQTSRY